MAIAAALVVMLLAAPAVHAAQHVVGGSTGWSNSGNVDYNTWSSGQTFNVGDTIDFNYNSLLHSVAEVSQSDYNGCDASNAIQTYSDGATSIPLSNAGTRYFICPTAGHCSGGMKVAIKVAGASGGSSGGSPSTPTTTTPSGSTTPSRGSSTPSTGGSSNNKEPSPAGSYGGAAVSVLYNMVFGSAVVVATMVALSG